MATILLADDDAAVRDLVRRALTSDGHKVQVTQDGLEALDILGTSASGIDILISDVDMPQLDGISLAEQALALKPSLAIVLMSGFSDQLERAARLRARKLLSITKPFTLDQIKQIVRTVLS
ncbi:response regulator [Hyphomicrobium sp. B1]|jgi:DNA-binding NtrC family response regulator|uniref:response regulator n=1 Tax=unclassified Hyphomicrobium TaxID=2619925 RepID=UPI00391B97C3